MQAPHPHHDSCLAPSLDYPQEGNHQGNREKETGEPWSVRPDERQESEKARSEADDCEAPAPSYLDGADVAPPGNVVGFHRSLEFNEIAAGVLSPWRL